MKILSHIPYCDAAFTIVNEREWTNEIGKTQRTYFYFHLPLAFLGQSANTLLVGNTLIKDDQKAIIFPHTDLFLMPEVYEDEKTIITDHNQFYTMKEGDYILFSHVELSEPSSSAPSSSIRNVIESVSYNIGAGRVQQHIKITL